MKQNYSRRGDWVDLPWPIQLGIMKTELVEYCDTDEERTNLKAEIERLEIVVRERTPKPPRWTEENAWQRPR
jgi:hypothetical protein